MNALRNPRPLNPRPHDGKYAELIIGIDVGTTFSGVCYAFLGPGEIPEIQSVMKFTDQKKGDTKVPSILYYDEDQILRAAGATAVSESIVHEAECEGWLKVQYFKMHMRPSKMVIDTHGLELGALPSSKTVVEVMGDFLRYLYLQALSYIEIHHTDSNELLASVSSRKKFVLSHPNGWDGLSQQRMREAAILGGLIEDSADGRARVSFVSEGEASALSCLAGGFCPPNLEPGYRFMIADAGGGTIDITSYEVTNSSPLRLKELTSSDCTFAGSVFVNRNARQMLQNILRGSHYDNPEILDESIDEHFENSTKREFKDQSKVSWLRVGDRSENDPKLGIRRGSLRLDGKDVASCFEHSIAETLKSIRAQVATCGGKAMPVWLVGGFAESPWLFEKLKEDLEGDGVLIRRPDINLAKAVAHGNVLYALEAPVSTRVTRSAYGIECRMDWNPFDPEHRRRKQLSYTDIDGCVVIPGIFDVIVNKNTEVKSTQRYSESYRHLITNPEDAAFQNVLYKFDSDAPPPYWYDGNEDKFQRGCSVTANLSALCLPSKRKMHNGKKYWILNYATEISFGLTELQARIKWEEDGETKYGPATIIYGE